MKKYLNALILILSSTANINATMLHLKLNTVAESTQRVINHQNHNQKKTEKTNTDIKAVPVAEGLESILAQALKGIKPRSECIR